MGVVLDEVKGRNRKSVGVVIRHEPPRDAASLPRVEFQDGQFGTTRRNGRRVTTMSIVAGSNQSSSVNGTEQSKSRSGTTDFRPEESDVRPRTCRDTLMGEVVHDFRNILNVVSILSELALLELPEASSVSKTVRNIKSACSDAANLCDRIMDDASKPCDCVEHVNLSTLVMGVSPLLTAYVPAKSTLRFDLIESAPLANASPDGVRRVLMNLVKNAAESLGDKPGSVTVSTGSVELDTKRTAESGYLSSTGVRRYSYVSVTDTGCGMDEATQARLFEQSFTTKSDGHGLGMASMRRIVDSFGGLIQVCSQVDYGTQVRVLFPQG